MDKIIINSLPKAGTNLVANIFDILEYQDKGNIGSHLILGKSLKSLVFNIVNKFFLKKGIFVGIDTPVEISRSFIKFKLSNIKSGEYISAHCGYTDEFLMMCEYYQLKSIVVTRDPRAILNSFVHYVVKNKNHYLHHYFNALSLDEKYEKALFGFLENGYILNSMNTRCHSLDNWINNDNSLQVKFEDVIGTSGGGSEIKQVESLNKILEFISYSENTQDTVTIIQNRLFGDRKNTFRKGIIDSWKDEIPESFQQVVNQELKTTIIKWGYEV